MARVHPAQAHPMRAAADRRPTGPAGTVPAEADHQTRWTGQGRSSRHPAAGWGRSSPATAWEQTAERLADQIRKGDQVYVSGRLETQSWEKDGEKKSKPSLTVRTMRKLEKNAPAQQQGGGNFASAQSAGFGAPQPPAPAQQDVWGAPQGGPVPF